MHTLYVFSVWLHILAAATWIGGMLFLVFVVVPWLRRGDRAQAAKLLEETGLRFRTVGWICFAILLATGSINLWARGVSLGDLVDPAWLSAPFGRAFLFKMTAFAGVLAVSFVHDFFIGPRATTAARRDPAGAEALRLRRLASGMGRANVLLALVIVAFAVMLVRGWAF